MAELRWAILLLMAVCVCQAQRRNTECGPCDKDDCPRAKGCLAGLVHDSCGCCRVCGRVEGEKCNNDTLPLPYKHVFGYCGEHLECRIRDDLAPEDPLEAICFCKHDEVLCGTDGKTYMNQCKMMEEAYRNRNGLKAASRGPCKAVPWVVSGPEDQTAVRGTNVALSCEGMGFPIPNIEWQMKRSSDGTFVDLPSDDQHIAVQARGGPERFEITGWLQILDFQDEDDGQYFCIVRNAEGDARASAHVKLTEKAEGNENEVEI